MFEDSERQLHQFTHGGTQGRHLGFASREQALIECLDVGVVAGGHHSSHVQRRSDPWCARFREPGPAMEAATRLTFDRDQAEKRGDLIGGLKRAAVQEGQQPLGGFVTHGRNRAQQVAVLP